MKRISAENPNTTEYWDRRYATEAEEMWKIWTTHDLIQKVAWRIPLRASVLDVGCGAGIVPARINKIRADIGWSACDFSIRSVKYLRELGLVKFAEVFQGDLTQGLPCESKAYDVALCTEVLEHLEDPAPAVQELARVARNRIIITVPNELSIPSSEHVWSYTRSDVLGLLQPYGSVDLDTCRSGRNIIGVCKLSK